MSIEKPFEGKLNESALEAQRDKFLDESIEFVLKTEEGSPIDPGEEFDENEIKNVDFLRMYSSWLASRVQNHLRKLISEERRPGKIIEQIRREYPMAIIIERIEERIKNGEKELPENIKRYIEATGNELPK